MVQHVWERCCKAKGVDRIIVATDDMRIAEAAFGFGAEVSMTSPDHPTGTDRLAEVAARLRGVDVVLNVQGDEPLIDPGLLTRLAKAMRVRKAPEMATAAAPFQPGEDPNSPNIVKVVLGGDQRALYFSRANIPYRRESVGELPTYRHIGLYAYQRRFLLKLVRMPQPGIERAECLEQLRALDAGATIRVLLTDRAAPGVDTPDDVAVVERLMKSEISVG